MVAFVQPVGMNLIRTDADGNTIPVKIAPPTELSISAEGIGGIKLASYPECTADLGDVSDATGTSDETVSSDTSYIQNYYDLIAGSYPSGSSDLCIVTDDENRVEANALTGLGISMDGNQEVPLIACGNGNRHDPNGLLHGNSDGTYTGPRTDYAPERT